MNKHEVRRKEFEMWLEQARRYESSKLRQLLNDKTYGFGFATAARQVLRERGELE